jgi:hypothetical protein
VLAQSHHIVCHPCDAPLEKSTVRKVNSSCQTQQNQVFLQQNCAL